jgi:hypothetical protein
MAPKNPKHAKMPSQSPEKEPINPIHLLEFKINALQTQFVEMHTFMNKLHHDISEIEKIMIHHRFLEVVSPKDLPLNEGIKVIQDSGLTAEQIESEINALREYHESKANTSSENEDKPTENSGESESIRDLETDSDQAKRSRIDEHIGSILDP